MWFVCCPLCVDRCVPVEFLLLVVGCLMRGCRLLFVLRCSSFVVRCVLSVVCCLLGVCVDCVGLFVV